MVEAICDVILGQVDGAGTWVGMVEQPEDARQGSPELHHFAGKVWDGVVINTKPGVVHNDSQALVMLHFDGHGRDA